nr:uncharacterized protein LOC107441471 [Parasteatoda tepidariorum]
MRCRQDGENLVDERNRLIRRLREEQMSNINLRKEVRGMEKEIETMGQKNVQKSCIIDGLQEVDEMKKCTRILNSDKKSYLQIEANDTREEMIAQLRCDVSLLRSKLETDKELLTILMPHKDELKDLLDTTKLEEHQKRHLQEIVMHTHMRRIRKFHWEFGRLLIRCQEKRTWIEESFQKLNSTSAAKHEEIAKDESENSKIIDQENSLLSDLINSQHQRICQIVDDMVEDIEWLCELRCDQYLIKEFIQLLRKKQEPESHQCLDEMEVM